MISSLTEEFSFLSNFYASELEVGGLQYPTLEHAYQAAKTTVWSEREGIRLASTPGKAKRLGQRVTLREDWEEEKVRVMLVLLRLKFGAEPLRSLLLETGVEEIVEGNDWGDVFWGRRNSDGVGQNWLGLLLMGVRYELRGVWAPGTLRV